jgi:hypothetical protein
VVPETYVVVVRVRDGDGGVVEGEHFVVVKPRESHARAVAERG